MNAMCVRIRDAMVFDLDKRYDVKTIGMECKNHTSQMNKTTIELNIYFDQTAKVQRSNELRW